MGTADLSTEYLGLELKNPVIVAAGPWSRDRTTLLKSVATGAAAVVTASIVSEASPTHRPRLSYRGNQLANIRLYSELTLEDWKSTIGDVKEAGGLLIASIMGETPSEIAYLAETVEKYGADAIEIGAAAPFGGGLEIVCSDPELVQRFTRAAVDSVKIPVSIKLSAMITNPVACARAAEAGGAAGISGIDAVRSFSGLDIETGEPHLPAIGGLSGESIRPISMALTSMISEAVTVPVCGIGGISGFSHAVEYFMLGASAVQVGSSILTHGYENIGRILNDLQQWMESHNRSSVGELCGIASGRISPFRDLRSDPLTAGLSEDCGRGDCFYCRNACTWNAVSFRDGSIRLDSDACTGCGICVDLCPEGLISMSWK